MINELFYSELTILKNKFIPIRVIKEVNKDIVIVTIGKEKYEYKIRRKLLLTKDQAIHLNKLSKSRNYIKNV